MFHLIGRFFSQVDGCARIKPIQVLRCLIQVPYGKSHSYDHQYKTGNGDSIADFFDKIKQTYASSKTILLVLDGAGYDRPQQVIDKAKELDIKVHHLPPYSQNLNPIERV